MKLIDFIPMLAGILGAEEKTLRVIIRELRQADLFTTGARGVNAPDLTMLDAVRVIIAYVASPSPSRAVEDVRYFGALKPDCRSADYDFTKELKLDQNETLEETLVRMAEDEDFARGFILGTLNISESGIAEISTGMSPYFVGVTQTYHHREQAESMTKATKRADQNDRITPRGASDHLKRLVKQSNVSRSATLPLQCMSELGTLGDDRS